MNLLKSLLLTGICFTLLAGSVFSQTVIAFQGAEGTFSDNWGYAAVYNAGGPLPPGPVTTLPRSGSFAIRAGGGNTVGCSGGTNCITGGGATGCFGHGKTIQFNPVNVACLTDVQLSVYHRSHTYCLGSGFDSGENLYFEVRINGGSWTIAGTVGGFGDYAWSYITNPAGSGITAANPFVYNVPPGTVTFEFRTRTNSNRGDEVYYIDDVKLTTTSTAYGFPGLAGLWHGFVDTNWNNICNWENRTIPTAATNVLIPNSALNSCEVLPFSTGVCNNIIVDKSRLAVEYFTSTLTVSGDLTIELNGELDLSLNSSEGGTLNIAGNWLNKRDESVVMEEGSTVVFNGSGTQAITVMNDTREAFYKLRLNNSGSGIIADDDIWIDQFNSGGASVMLELTDGFVDLNARELLVYNPNTGAVQRINGGIISERTDNQSRVTWKTMNTLDAYTFPFVTIANAYIPFVIEPVSGAAGDITIATYATPADNLPWPVTPVLVQNLTSSIGLTPDNRDATVDRFWQIDVTGSASANLTFNYAASELPAAPYNTPSGLKAQRYHSATDTWQPYLPGQSAGTYWVTVPSVTNFSTWTLTNEISPLPIELLSFDARLNSENTVDVHWITATEINNNFFTVEKSQNGKDFVPFRTVVGAGNSTNILNYQTTDENPFTGISYYRLKQTDFDGRYSYSPVSQIKLFDSETGFNIFPNPAENEFFVSLSAKETAEKFFVTEMNGKVILEIDLHQQYTNGNLIRISTQTLAAGVYLAGTTVGRMEKIVIRK